MTELTITRPDDWHVHLRDGEALVDTCADMARYFGRVIVMPNLTPPVATVADAAAYVEAFKGLERLYIADGHHRAASAARIASELDNPPESGEHEWFMGVLFPSNQLRVLPYNRCITGLNGLSGGAFLDRVRAAFNVAPTDHPEPDAGVQLRNPAAHHQARPLLAPEVRRGR